MEQLKYKNIITISGEDIDDLKISSEEKFDWIDFILKNKYKWDLPSKTRMPLNNADYFNVMPCAIKEEGVLGLKVVTRNEKRNLEGGLNIDGDILLYEYDNFKPIALIDGATITTMRTAAVAAHSVLNFTWKKDIISILGLGRIGTQIAEILIDQMGGGQIEII